MALGKLDSHIQKNEIRPFSYTIQKDKLKMDERPQCETGIHQNPKREHTREDIQMANRHKKNGQHH